MKKIVVGFAIMLVLVTGCGKSEEEKMADYEDIMKEYADHYFQNYGASGGLNIYEVSIDLLKRANDAGVTNYDLTKLEDCSSDSKVLLTLKEDTKEVEDYNYQLNCKID